MTTRILVCYRCGAESLDSGSWAPPTPGRERHPPDSISHSLCDKCCARELFKIGVAEKQESGGLTKVG